MENNISEKEQTKEKKTYPNKINFVDGVSSWEDAKKLSRKLTKKYSEPTLALHKGDTLKCKPFSISQTLSSIALVFYSKKFHNQGSEELVLLLDEAADKRRIPTDAKILKPDFWLYRGVSRNKEYIILNDEKLDNNLYNFKGTIIELKNSLEINKSLRLDSVSNIFITGEAIPIARILTKEELIELSKYLKKNLEWDENGFKKFVFLHEQGYICEYPPEIELMLLAFFLSSKYLGYPLSIAYMGSQGSGKTSLIESTDLLFKDTKRIFEAANSTLKGLIPSYRERPLNPGYLFECHRMGLIDELFKMISQKDKQKQYENLNTDYFGQLNMILEHKKRTIGSGNTNQMEIQATAKFLFATNRYPGLTNLEQHMGVIDETTLSRLLIYVTDEEHQRMVNDKKNNNTTENIGKGDISKDIIINWKGKELNPFLTIYDTCQNFLIEFDNKRLNEIFNNSLKLVGGKLRGIWEPRGWHHLVLLLDGIVKFRCIFKDYDSEFTPKEEDYKNLEKVITKILNSWKCDLTFYGDK